VRGPGQPLQDRHGELGGAQVDGPHREEAIPGR
jgi:hypothetical protein